MVIVFYSVAIGMPNYIHYQHTDYVGTTYNNAQTLL